MNENGALSFYVRDSYGELPFRVWCIPTWNRFAVSAERDIRGVQKWMEAEQERRERDDIPVPGPALSVEGLAQLYLKWAEGRRDDGKLSQTHYASKASHLTRFADAFGRRQADSMAGSDIDDFINGLQRAGLTAHYVRDLIHTVSAMFNWAVKPAKTLAANPLKGEFARPAAPRAPERYADRAEAALWLWHIWRRSKPRSVANRYDRLLALLRRLMKGSAPGTTVVETTKFSLLDYILLIKNILI